jgi:hypothetical protein
MAEAIKSPVFEEVFQNLRKVTEANLKMQKELFSQWSSMWPGVPTPQTAWLDKMRQFRTQWIKTISDLAHHHQEVVDRQYKAAVESLDAALAVNEADSPEEYRRRTEQFARKALDCMREMSESQVKEMQETVTKMTDLVAKVGP